MGLLLLLESAPGEFFEFVDELIGAAAMEEEETMEGKGCGLNGDELEEEGEFCCCRDRGPDGLLERELEATAGVLTLVAGIIGDGRRTTPGDPPGESVGCLCVGTAIAAEEFGRGLTGRGGGADVMFRGLGGSSGRGVAGRRRAAEVMTSEEAIEDCRGGRGGGVGRGPVGPAFLSGVGGSWRGLLNLGLAVEIVGGVGGRVRTSISFG